MYLGYIICRACSRYGERNDANRVLVGKPVGRRPLRRPRCRWKNNIKVSLREVGWGMEWIDLAQARERWRAVVIAVMNLRIPQNSGNFLSS
jgi:hypothetical protein